MSAGIHIRHRQFSKWFAIAPGPLLGCPRDCEIEPKASKNGLGRRPPPASLARAPGPPPGNKTPVSHHATDRKSNAGRIVSGMMVRGMELIPLTSFP
jgi:hypothetical protein